MQRTVRDSQYSVSIEALDTQHEKIIEILDRLVTTVGPKGAENSILSSLEEVLRTIKGHFEYEETLMKKNGYPSFILHKNMHDAFLRQFSNQLKKWKTVTEPPSTQDIAFLKRWFIDHIIGADKLYTPFLNQRGIS